MNTMVIIFVSVYYTDRVETYYLNLWACFRPENGVFEYVWRK